MLSLLDTGEKTLPIAWDNLTIFWEPFPERGQKGKLRESGDGDGVWFDAGNNTAEERIEGVAKLVDVTK